MFQSLSEKLENAFRKFKSKGKLTESDIKAGMREIKLALLEADVNFKVVKDFIASVSERAVGAEVLESLLPGQQVVKIVNEELTKLMGGSQSKLTISSKPPTVVMMVGLQGAGKTTHAGKLAGLYKKQGKNPLLVACDVYRPAAIKQLEIVGEKLGIPVFTLGDKESPVKIAEEGIKYANKKGDAWRLLFLFRYILDKFLYSMQIRRLIVADPCGAVIRKPRVKIRLQGLFVLISLYFIYAEVKPVHQHKRPGG
jgi:signal recognition particle subunit SRP54